jgi:glycogen debranching enzyme
MNADLTNDAPVPGPGAPHVQFYIPATSSLLERRPRTLKHGDTFGLFDHYGDIVPHDGSPEGLYHRDTRFLSGFELLLNDRRPLLLSSTVQDNNAYLTADLINPHFIVGGHLQLPRDTIHIVRSKLLWRAQAHERLAIRNFDDRPHEVRLTVLFESDFADLFEVRGHRRSARGRITARTRAARAAVLTYRGLAQNVWHTIIDFEPKPDLIRHNRAVFELTLKPGQRVSLFVTITCERDRLGAPGPERFFTCMREARRELRRMSGRRAAIVTSNAIFNEVICRSMADLTMLTTVTPPGALPLRRHPLVQHRFWPGRHHHRCSAPLGRPDDRPGRAQIPRREPGNRLPRGSGCRARQDPA